MLFRKKQNPKIAEYHLAIEKTATIVEYLTDAVEMYDHVDMHVTTMNPVDLLKIMRDHEAKKLAFMTERSKDF